MFPCSFAAVETFMIARWLLSTAGPRFPILSTGSGGAAFLGAGAGLGSTYGGRTKDSPL